MPGLNKAALRRDIEKDRRERQRRRVLELRALVALEMLKRQEARATVKLQCRTARVKLREQCAIRAERAKTEGAARIDRARRDVREEKNLERIIRSGDLKVRKRGVRSTARERNAESDDEVRRNIGEEFHLAWEKNKKHIKGTSRMTRTEAFLKWAEENPGEVYALQNEDADAYIRKLVDEHNREARASGLESMAVPF